MRRVLTLLVVIFVACSAFELDFQNEFKDLYDEVSFGPHYRKSIQRREDVDSSEEIEEVKPSSETPSDLDVVSGIIGDHNVGDEILNTAFNPFFNIFNIGDAALFPGYNTRQSIPWWRGPNVCTERKEEISDWNSPKTATEKTEESANSEARQFASAGFHFSFNTCSEKANKRICKTVVDENGRKKVMSVSQQCCKGYGRKKNSQSANIHMPCEELHLRSLIETSERLEGREFIRSAQKNDIDDQLRKNITLFLPTDATFTEFAEQLLESNLVVLPGSRSRRGAEASGVTTKSIILNHVVPEVISIEDVENEQLLVTAYDNSTIRMNIFPKPPGSRKHDESPYQYTANCALISKADQEAENGMVHVVDRVLMPVTKSLMKLVSERNDMTVLQTILEKTNLAEQLENSEKVFTLFAPTDKAFEKLDPHIRRTIKEGKGCALNILKNHILELTLCSAAVADGSKTNALNMMGERMSLERVRVQKSNSEEPSEAADLAGAQTIMINGKSEVVENDIMATNGVMHVIDTFLPTDSSLPLTSMLESRNLTSFKSLIELSGLDEAFDSFENVSVFAPTNEALSSNVWVKKMESDPESLKGNEELAKFLKYHIAKPLIKTCDLSEKSLDTEAGDKVRINLYSTHGLFNVFNRATVNCARLVHFDDDSCGSVLHQVDKPLEPPTRNLLETLKANDQYSMFAELIETANLTSLLSNENSSLTLLVPKNDVFTEVKEYFDKLSNDDNKEKLENLVKSHIIDDVVCCAGIVPSEWPFVRFVKTINNVNLKLNRDRRPKLQNAGVTKCDIISKNGIIHEINDVINPRQLQRTPVSRSESDSSEESSYVPTAPKRPLHDFLFSFP